MSVVVLPAVCRAAVLCACALLTGLLSATAAAAPAPQRYAGEEFDAKAFAASTRRSYELQDFSDRYRATLEVEDNDEVFRPGIVRVFARGNATPLLEVASSELVLDTDGKSGKVKANVHELPYGEQSVLIYDDFNFDGIKDLAVMDGQNSCYHGPSYQVYLGTADGFQASSGFTELAQSNCGLFQVDAQARELHTDQGRLLLAPVRDVRGARWRAAAGARGGGGCAQRGAGTGAGDGVPRPCRQARGRHALSVGRAGRYHRGRAQAPARVPPGAGRQAHRGVRQCRRRRKAPSRSMRRSARSSGWTCCIRMRRAKRWTTTPTTRC